MVLQAAVEFPGWPKTWFGNSVYRRLGRKQSARATWGSGQCREEMRHLSGWRGGGGLSIALQTQTYSLTATDDGGTFGIPRTAAVDPAIKPWLARRIQLPLWTPPLRPSTLQQPAPPSASTIPPSTTWPAIHRLRVQRLCMLPDLGTATGSAAVSVHPQTETAVSQTMAATYAMAWCDAMR